MSFCKSFELIVFVFSGVRSSMTLSGGGIIASTKGDESTMVLSSAFENLMATKVPQSADKDDFLSVTIFEFTPSISSTTDLPPISVISQETTPSCTTFHHR
jgi:hypothetical protein